MCDTWQAMCVTHGMPCVNMHGTLRAINRSSQIQFGQAANSVRGGSSKEEEEEGRKGEREERKGERKGERKEEKRRINGRKRGKRKRKRKECCALSRLGRQRTRNCTTRGRFPPTLVILLLGAV